MRINFDGRVGVGYGGKFWQFEGTDIASGVTYMFYVSNGLMGHILLSTESSSLPCLIDVECASSCIFTHPILPCLSLSNFQVVNNSRTFELNDEE